jgi:hypothetical protein
MVWMIAGITIALKTVHALRFIIDPVNAFYLMVYPHGKLPLPLMEHVDL